MTSISIDTIYEDTDDFGPSLQRIRETFKMNPKLVLKKFEKDKTQKNIRSRVLEAVLLQLRCYGINFTIEQHNFKIDVSILKPIKRKDILTGENITFPKTLKGIGDLFLDIQIINVFNLKVLGLYYFFGICRASKVLLVYKELFTEFLKLNSKEVVNIYNWMKEYYGKIPLIVTEPYYIVKEAKLIEPSTLKKTETKSKEIEVDGILVIDYSERSILVKGPGMFKYYDDFKKMNGIYNKHLQGFIFKKDKKEDVVRFLQS